MISHPTVEAIAAHTQTVQSGEVECRLQRCPKCDQQSFGFKYHAWTTHGTSLALYVDNAKVYHSRALHAACLRLNVRTWHRKVGDPPGGGLIERFFETAQSQFEAEVRAGDILTLDQLNRGFSAWLAISYHQRPNAETKQTPEARYQKGLSAIRHVDMDAVLESFMRRENRQVHGDFSDVQLNHRFYRVDKTLRGDRVEVRYDPFGQCQSVLIYSLHEEYLGKGVLHERQQGEAADPVPPAKPRLFLQILEKAQQSEPTTVLVLDEAHLIGPESLVDLRLLVSSLAEERPPLKMVLSGQESLRDQLKRSCHAALVHRISVRYHIAPMSSQQTAAYIDHHLTTAGAGPKIFEPEAKTLIHDYAGGLPRQVNNISTACLINAAAANLPKINEPLVNQTITECQLP